MGETQLDRKIKRNLINARKEARLSQTEVAKILGLDQSTISKFELGIISPNASNMKKISELYNKDVNFLLFS